VTAGTNNHVFSFPNVQLGPFESSAELNCDGVLMEITTGTILTNIFRIRVPSLASNPRSWDSRTRGPTDTVYHGMIDAGNATAQGSRNQIVTSFAGQNGHQIHDVHAFNNRPLQVIIEELDSGGNAYRNQLERIILVFSVIEHSEMEDD
jgi:hypothetical protein